MRKALLVTLIVGGVTTACFGLLASNIGRERARQIFAFEADRIEETVFEHIQASDAVAKSMQAFFQASVSVEADEFRVYSNEIMTRYPFLRSVIYYPRVRHANRSAFEADQKLLETLDFQIFEYDGQHKIPAAERPIYFPAVYCEPFTPQDAMLLGYDILSNSDISPTLTQVIRTGSAFPSPLRTRHSRQGYDVFIATYEGKGLPDTPASRQEQVSGLLSLTIDPAAILGDLSLNNGFTVHFVNRSFPDTMLLLHASGTAPGLWQQILTLTFIETFAIDISAQRFDLTIIKQVPLFDLELWFVAIALIGGSLGSSALFLILRGHVNLEQELRTRQRAEHLLQELNKDLERRIEERTAEITRQAYILDMFMATVPDAIYFKDRQSRIIRANQAHAIARGFGDPSEEIGKTDFDFFPETIARAKYDQEQAILKTGEPLSIEEPETQGHWKLTTKMPLRDEHGDIIGTFGISRDITALKTFETELIRAKEAAEAVNLALRQTQQELRIVNQTLEDRVAQQTRILQQVNAQLTEEIEERKQAEIEVRTLNQELELRVRERTARLEASNKELQDFAYIVSHDLKAPLRGIANLVTWMSTDYPDRLDARGQEMCSLLLDRVARLNGMIDGILRYSRAGHEAKENIPVDLNLLLQEILTMLAPPSHIHIQITSPLPTLRADPVRLTQIFQNLIGNAIKFLDKPQGEIMVSCTEDQIFWTFRVQDNGPGIPPKDHARIFQLFHTVSSYMTHGQSGIGLAIVKKLVEGYGGEIHVESTEGAGSTFVFTLPRTIPGDQIASLKAEAD